MIVKITSDHPELMSLLQKNPNTFEGIQAKSLKSGTAIGFVAGPQEYHMIFQDTKYSFCDDMSNQIDFQSHCNPRAFLSLSSEMIRHTLLTKEKWFDTEIPWLDLKVEGIDTPGYNHVLEIENVYADGFRSNMGFVLSKYFPEIKLTHKSGRLFSLRVETNESLHRLVNLASLACMYIAATNKQRWYLNNDIVRKYIRIIKNLTPVPYFVLYLFAKRCIRSPTDFESLKDELSSAFDGDVNLTWGSTQDMRIRAVRERLVVDGNISHNVIEIGCGEMDYPNRFIKCMDEGTTWYANDKEDYSHIADLICSRKSIDNLVFVEDVWGIKPSHKRDSTVLMIEMIEHMPVLDSLALVSKVLGNIVPNRLIITTPNFTFNRHFGFDGDRVFRHDDHHFELTSIQFQQYIGKVMEKFSHLYDVEYFGVGDQADGDYLSLGAEINRR